MERATEKHKQNAIAFYVTEPGATLPMGPGTPVGGKTYWALAAEEFPTGFTGPITYGVAPDGARDDSGTHEAPEGGEALVPGTCYELSVVTNRFTIGKYQIVLPE